MFKKLTRLPLANLKRTLALAFALAGSAAHAASGAQDVNLATSQPLNPLMVTTNTIANQRISFGQKFEGVAALDGLARLTATSSAGQSYSCTGSLLAGGAYLLTAAHCADFTGSMSVSFGFSKGASALSRTAAIGDVVLHPDWKGTDSLGYGSDLALIKLNSAVTTISGYRLSGGNDIGKTFLSAGYGSSATAGSTRKAADLTALIETALYGHFAYNSWDTDFQSLDRAVSGTAFDGTGYVGTTYMSDFDSANTSNNTLQRIADATGGGWTSGGALDNKREGMIDHGDSGGGDFVWTGGEWLLSGVHSVGIYGNVTAGKGQGFCDLVGITDCSAASSGADLYGFGDLAGSTAVFDQLAWISSVVGSQVMAVPEPESLLMLAAGLLAMAQLSRRRRARHSYCG